MNIICHLNEILNILNFTLSDIYKNQFLVFFAIFVLVISCESFTLEPVGESLLVKSEYVSSNGIISETRFYEYDSLRNQIRLSGFNSTEGEIFKEEFEYDIFNNIISDSKYYKGNFLGRFLYRYDNRQNRSEFILVKSNGEIGDRITYNYNTKNQLTVETNFDSIGNIQSVYKYIYDLDGRLLREEIYDSSGQIESFWETFYNDDGMSLIKHFYRLNQETLVLTYKIEQEFYDLNYQLIKENRSFNISGELIVSIQCKYDHLNNLLEKVSNNFERDFKKTESYSYKYDDYGNIIEKENYVHNVLISTTKNEYEYVEIN